MVQNIPAALLSLAREALDAVISTADPAQFGGTAVYDQRKDEIFKALPSFAPGAEAISTTPLVAERYGEEFVGERLALQFIYQLFPRSAATGLASDAHQLWRRFLSELNRAEWIFRGVANLRKLSVAPGLPEVINLADGISIRPRSRTELLALGFDSYTLDKLDEDARAAIWGWSNYVMCGEERRAKTPANFLLGGSVTFRTAHRAVACLRLAGPGDASIGPMFNTRPTRFDVGSTDRWVTGSFVPVSPGLADYELTQRPLSPTKRHSTARHDIWA